MDHGLLGNSVPVKPACRKGNYGCYVPQYFRQRTRMI